MTKEDINKAADYTYYDKVIFYKVRRGAFVVGALSQAAKDYWYNEFKQEQMAMREKTNEIPLDLRNQPLKPSECYRGKSNYKMTFKDK